MFDVDDDRMFVVETAIRHKLGTKEEIELYEELSLALELMDNEKFKIVGSGIGGGIDFSKCQETSTYENQGERHFQFKLKKH
jgi:hypothetical protein